MFFKTLRHNVARLLVKSTVTDNQLSLLFNDGAERAKSIDSLQAQIRYLQRSVHDLRVDIASTKLRQDHVDDILEQNTTFHDTAEANIDAIHSMIGDLQNSVGQLQGLFNLSEGLGNAAAQKITNVVADLGNAVSALRRRVTALECDHEFAYCTKTQEPGGVDVFTWECSKCGTRQNKYVGELTDQEHASLVDLGIIR